jgi:hypothetical protein
MGPFASLGYHRSTQVIFAPLGPSQRLPEGHPVAGVAELVDALDLGSSDASRG